MEMKIHRYIAWKELHPTYETWNIFADLINEVYIPYHLNIVETNWSD